MNNDVTGYKKLIVAVIKVATSDYCSNRISRHEFRNFCIYHKFFDWIDIDRERYYKGVLKNRKKVHEWVGNQSE